MEKKIKGIRIAYVLSLIILITFEVLILSGVLSVRKVPGETAVSLQQLLILLFFGLVPGTLYLTGKKMKKVMLIDDNEKKIESFYKIEILRLAAFGTLGIFTLLIQLFSTLKGIEALFVIIVFLFVFIWPTLNRMMQETGMNVVENVSEEDDNDNKENL
jgi:hypothetical protein